MAHLVLQLTFQPEELERLRTLLAQPEFQALVRGDATPPPVIEPPPVCEEVKEESLILPEIEPPLPSVRQRPRRARSRSRSI